MRPAPGPKTQASGLCCARSTWWLSAFCACALTFGPVNPTEALGLPRLQEGMRRLEPLLTASVVTGDSFLDEVTTHLIAASGCDPSWPGPQPRAVAATPPKTT